MCRLNDDYHYISIGMDKLEVGRFINYVHLLKESWKGSVNPVLVYIHFLIHKEEEEEINTAAV